MRSILVVAVLALALHAEEAAPSSLQRRLIGHWYMENDTKLNIYYSQTRRMVDRSIPNSDAVFGMMDYKVWDEWPEQRTLILSIEEGGSLYYMLVVTFSEDGKTAVCREKGANGWVKAFRIKKVDDKTHPAKLPEKLKMLDLDSGLGETP